MVDLTFKQAISTIIGMRGKIVRASGETLAMVGLSTTIIVVFGTLSGVLLFVISSRQLHYNKPVNFLLDNLINLMRVFPFVIPIIAMIPATRAITGSIVDPITTSLVLSVSGLFYFARLVEQNLHGVPKGVTEVATVMGASPPIIVRKVLLNGARADMVSSIAVLTIGLLLYSAAAGMTGSGGLDDLATRYGYRRYQTEVIILIVTLLVLLITLVQSAGNALVRKLDRCQRPNTKMPPEKYA